MCDYNVLVQKPQVTMWFLHLLMNLVMGFFFPPLDVRVCINKWTYLSARGYSSTFCSRTVCTVIPTFIVDAIYQLQSVLFSLLRCLTKHYGIALLLSFLICL